MACKGKIFKRHKWSSWQDTGRSGTTLYMGVPALGVVLENPYPVGRWTEQERFCEVCNKRERNFCNYQTGQSLGL